MSFTPTIKIALLDDHSITLDGLKAVLKEEASIEIVCACSNWNDFKRRIEGQDLDLAILDIHLSKDPDIEDGLEIAQFLLHTRKDMKCIMLSFSATSEEISRAKDVKVSGYLLKEDTADELIKAIHAVAREDKTYFSQGVLSQWFNEGNTKAPISLTPREKDILSYISRGHNVPQIHKMTGWNKAVIRTHKKHIMQKLDIHNVEQLVVWGRDHGYHDMPVR